MKRTRYLCLDDKPEEVRLALRRLADATIGLAIGCSSPLPLREQVEDIRDRSSKNRLDGLIVDLRLDQSAPANTQPVDYKAQQLASELRSLMAERKLRDFPIALWSISQKFARSYDRDVMSHDLFDLVFDKERIQDQGGLIAQQLVSLSHGYARIGNTKRNTHFLDRL